MCFGYNIEFKNGFTNVKITNGKLQYFDQKHLLTVIQNSKLFYKLGTKVLQLQNFKNIFGKVILYLKTVMVNNIYDTKIEKICKNFVLLV